MRMPETGRAWPEIEQDMIARGAGDAKWRDGRTAVYVFNAGEDVSLVQHEAYCAYMSENGLGPMAFPSLAQMEQQALGMAAQGGLMAFSREHETEADKIGLELLVRACYDPREAPELWQRMGQIGGGQRPPEWMSTHPASETRAANFRAWMPAAIEMYESRCGALD